MLKGQAQGLCSSPRGFHRAVREAGDRSSQQGALGTVVPLPVIVLPHKTHVNRARTKNHPCLTQTPLLPTIPAWCQGAGWGCEGPAARWGRSSPCCGGTKWDQWSLLFLTSVEWHQVAETLWGCECPGQQTGPRGGLKCIRGQRGRARHHLHSPQTAPLPPPSSAPRGIPRASLLCDKPLV